MKTKVRVFNQTELVCQQNKMRLYRPEDLIIPRHLSKVVVRFIQAMIKLDIDLFTFAYSFYSHQFFDFRKNSSINPSS